MKQITNYQLKTKKMQSKKTVTKKEAAQLLGITLPTVDAWIKSEKVKLSTITVGLRKRVLMSEIEELKKNL